MYNRVVGLIGLALLAYITLAGLQDAPDAREARTAVLATAASAPAPAAPIPRHATHEVQPGETLSSIAQAYGTTVDVLIVTNALEDPNSLAAGQLLRVPPPAPRPPLRAR